MTIRWTTENQKTVPQMLIEARQKWGDQIFLDFKGDKYTYAEVDDLSTRMAHGLLALNVAKGDRICAVLDNRVEQVLIWFAANKIGAIFVGLNTALKGDFLRHQISDSDPAVVCVEEHYLDRLVAIEGQLPGVKTVLVRGEIPNIRTRFELRKLESSKADSVTPLPIVSAPSDLSMLIYTSGTTGASKGCMISHNYVIRFGRQIGYNVCMTPGDIVWTPCPLFHAAALLGIVCGCMVYGCTASIYPRFSVSDFWPEIERSRATTVLLLSTMLTLIPDQPDTEASKRCYGQVRILFGAPLPAALRKRWKERFGIKHVSGIGYSCTEAGSMVYYRVDYPDLPDGATGRRYADFDVKIIDDDGNECPPGQPGEVVARPTKPDIMYQGYWRRPEATLAVWKDLWFHTGDIGKFDENDIFYFVDRKKDYLRRGGENISSFEVEAVFLAHDAIAEAGVHAVKTGGAEDEVKLTAVLKPGAKVSEEELCRWSLDRLPYYAVPRFVEFRDHLPRTPTNRIQKYALRDEGVTPTTWDRNKSNVTVKR